MKKSHYFSDLIRRYHDEIDDLLSDSAGASVLQKRLNEKRREIDAILPMIEFSPEMVAVAFYDAFGFAAPSVMQNVAQSDPADDGFMRWRELKADLTVAGWAEPLVSRTLKAEGGDAFLVVAATLEFLRNRSFSDVPEVQEIQDEDAFDSEENGDGDRVYDSDDVDDLGEAGADWLSEQGFETPDR